MSPRPVCFISTLSLQLSQDSPPIPKRKGNAKATLAYHSCTALRQVFHWESSTWPQWANRKGQILLSLPWGIPPQGGICMWITLEKKCVSRHLSLKTKKKCCCEFCHLIFSLTGFWGWVMLWDFFFFFYSQSWSTGHCHYVAVSPFSWQTDFLLERHYYLTGSTHPATDLFYFCSWQRTATIGNVSFLIWASPSEHFSKLTLHSSLSKHRISWKDL